MKTEIQIYKYNESSESVSGDSSQLTFIITILASSLFHSRVQNILLSRRISEFGLCLNPMAVEFDRAIPILANDGPTLEFLPFVYLEIDPKLGSSVMKILASAIPRDDFTHLKRMCKNEMNKQ